MTGTAKLAQYEGAPAIGRHIAANYIIRSTLSYIVVFVSFPIILSVIQSCHQKIRQAQN
jgi:hypothetical protein